MPHSNMDYPASKQECKRLFEQIIQAGRAGKSHTQMAAMIGISREKMTSWLAEHPEFKTVVTLADDYALAWWEALGQRHAETREGNATMIMFIMKNRFEQDYGKDGEGELSALPDMSILGELAPKTRQKLRKILNAEAGGA